MDKEAIAALDDLLSAAKSAGPAHLHHIADHHAKTIRTALAQQPAAQAVGLTDERFIAAHGKRLAAMLGIQQWWDIADRDARIREALLSRAAPTGPVVAWVRFCSNGGVEGPIMDWDRRMDDARRKSGAWTPLGVIAAPQPSAQQAEPTHLQRWSRVIKELPMAEQPAEEARGVDALTRFRYTERDGMVEDRAMGEWVLLDAVKALLAGPAAADARTQSGAHGLAPIHIGNLTTLNQDTYPGLGDWWVQLRIGPDFDEVLARVYGKCPEQARQRAAILARAASEPRAEGLEAGAAAQFAEWFAANYPGPDTIIHNPHWHAPRIYRAALAAQKKGA